jgi:hypothetical protein
MELLGKAASDVFDQRDRLQETFLTEVPEQGGHKTAPVDGSLTEQQQHQGGGGGGDGGGGGPSTGHVEQQVVPPFNPSCPADLPGAVETATIMDAAVRSIFDAPTSPLRGNEAKRLWWESHFLSQESMEVVQDVFWWFFLAKERPDPSTQRYRCVRRCSLREGFEISSRKLGMLEVGESVAALEVRRTDRGLTRIRCEAGWLSETTPAGAPVMSREIGASAQQQYQLFDRAADNFTMLFMNVPDKQKDAFFEHYHDALAQSVFAAFFTAYPHSRYKFEAPRFRQHICGMVAEWTTGRRAFANTMDTDSWAENRLLRPVNMDKETEDDERRRVVHQRYMEVIHTGPSGPRGQGGHRGGHRGTAGGGSRARGGAAAERQTMFAVADRGEAGQAESGLDDPDDEQADSDDAPETDGIDVYSNSPFIQHFLLTHNCNPQSQMRSSRLDFAAYYAALPNSSLLAGESVRINDEMIAYYERLRAKTSDVIHLARRNTKLIKEKLEQHRDYVLSTCAHDFSSRIVSIVAQREQLRRKALAQELGRATAMGSAASGSRSGRKAKAAAAAKTAKARVAESGGGDEDEDDENAIDEATAPSRLREANAHAAEATLAADDTQTSPAVAAGAATTAAAAAAAAASAAAVTDDGGLGLGGLDPERSKRAKAERVARWERELREASEQSKEEPLKPLDPTQKGVHVLASGGAPSSNRAKHRIDAQTQREQREVLSMDVSRRRSNARGGPTVQEHLTERQSIEAVQLALAKKIMLRDRSVEQQEVADG